VLLAGARTIRRNCRESTVDEEQAIKSFLMRRDEETFGVLFQAVYGRVFRYFLLRGAGEMAAEELAQNVLLAVYRRAGEFTDDRVFRGWLFAIARNELLQHWRRDRARVRTVELEPLRDVLAVRPAAGDALWRLEFEAWLGSLGAAERELAHLRFVEGLSHEELAAAFDVPRGTAQQTRPLDTDEVQFKLDHALTGAHQLTGSYFHQRGKDVERMRGNLAWVDREFTWKQHNLNLSDTWTLSPTMINQFRVTYVRLFGGRLNTLQKSLGDFGSRFNVQGPPTLPQIQVAGRFNLNVAIGGPVGGSRCATCSAGRAAATRSSSAARLRSKS
jgi:RNA polymerase sigma factor (sigma-70 family)